MSCDNGTPRYENGNHNCCWPMCLFMSRMRSYKTHQYPVSAHLTSGTSFAFLITTNLEIRLKSLIDRVYVHNFEYVQTKCRITLTSFIEGCVKFHQALSLVQDKKMPLFKF